MKRICFALAFFAVLVLPVLVLAQPAPGMPPDDLGRHMLTPADLIAPHDGLGRPHVPVPSALDMPSGDLGLHMLARYDLVALPDVRSGQRPLALLDAAALADDRSRHILTPAALDVSADDHDHQILARPAPVMPPDMLAGQHALAQPDPNAPHDDLGQHIGNVIDAVRSGSAIAIAAALIMLLTSLFKAPWLGSIVLKIPKRWRIAIPIILSGIAGVLSSIVGGIPWQEAVLVGLFAGPTAVFAHEAVVEAILGRARTRTPHLAS